MKILVAAEDSGSLKEVQFIPGTDTSKKIEDPEKEPKISTYQEQGRKNCIDRFIQLSGGKIAAARRSGQIEIYDEEFEVVKSWTCKEFSGKCVGLQLVGTKIVSADENGNVFIIEHEKKEYQELLHVKISSGPLSVFVYSDEVFGFGGKDVDLEVISIDLDTAKVSKVFKAKNVKNDKLDLKVPVWINDIRILDKKHFIATTHYGQIRQYDIDHGRRPIIDTKVCDHALKHIVKGPTDTSVIVSDSHSSAEQFDLKRQLVGGKYAGPTGAVQALHSADNVLALGGLDRYLRVYNTASRQQVGKVFIGTQITGVLVIEDDSDQEKIENDELWDELERSSKKRKI